MPTGKRADEIQLAAVQMRLSVTDYWTRSAFEEKIDGLMQEVAGTRAPGIPTLVVFPEDVGLMLVAQGMERALGRSRSIEGAIAQGIRANVATAGWERVRHRLSWVPALFLARHEVIASTYFEVFSHMASRYGVYVVAGSVVLPPYEIDDVRRRRYRPVEGRVYNVSYLFGPSGEIVGSQRKTRLIPLEESEALNLAAGKTRELRALETPLGRVGIAICLDAFHDEVVDRLRDERTDILVMPSANPGPWSEWQQTDWLRGAHRSVVELGAFEYAVNAMMTGALFDLDFFGQSSILSRDADRWGSAGYEATGPAQGFVQVAESAEREAVLIARVPHP